MESRASESKNSERRQAKRNPPAQHNISGDNSLRVPPVPIPNTEVKPQHADGTWLATARESRSSPDSIRDIRLDVSFLLLSAKSPGKFYDLCIIYLKPIDINLANVYTNVGE